jgi:predicted enzyme related to lactoylglutathione lyase
MLDAGTHGVVNWVDLSTPDVEAAVDFYGPLFGWSIEKTTTPMGEYFVGSAQGREVAGMMAQDPEIVGAPAMWTTFVFVDDIDVSVEAVLEHGGNVLTAPFEIPGDARVAVVADPTGAMFAVITGPRPDAPYFGDEEGAVCWVELLTRDPAAAEAFYAGVFGWKAETQIMGGTAYTTFSLGEDRVAGMMMMPDEVPSDAPAHWSVYFATKDCAHVESRAVELGGEILVPRTQVGVGTFAFLSDPLGAKFGIMGDSGT